MAIATKQKLHTPELRRGDLIREARVTKRLRQSDVATWINAHDYKIRINQKRISQIEAGSDLRGSELFAIADCFGLDVNRLRCF